MEKEKKFLKTFLIGIIILFVLDTAITFLIALNFPREFPFVERNALLVFFFKRVGLWTFAFCPFILFGMCLLIMGTVFAIPYFLFPHNKLKFTSMYTLMTSWFIIHSLIIINNFRLFFEAKGWI